MTAAWKEECSNMLNDYNCDSWTTGTGSMISDVSQRLSALLNDDYSTMMNEGALWKRRNARHGAAVCQIVHRELKSYFLLSTSGIESMHHENWVWIRNALRSLRERDTWTGEWCCTLFRRCKLRKENRLDRTP